jgi:hypothetical protein
MESEQEAAEEREQEAAESQENTRRAVEPEGDRIAASDATPEANATAEARADEATQEAGETPTQLFAGNEREEAERRWRDIQANFVDEPRSSVEEANTLVADLMDRLVSGFGAERSRLEAQWGRGEDVTTEELRVVLQRYRSFFSRLLDV